MSVSPNEISSLLQKMSDVPTELFREILLRLPAESLFRLRSVCKGWQRIIDNPSFIKAHTNNQIYDHTLLVRNETGAPLFSFSLDSLRFVNDLQKVDATRIKQLIRHGVPRLPLLSYVASCNGLILISHRDLVMVWVIWNPLTRDFHELPPRPPNPYAADLSLSGFGFGYDYDADDYKVVRIDRLFSAGEMVYHTLVYSLKSDSWSRIQDCPDCTGWLRRGVFLNGTLYWLSREMVIALDIRTQTYSQFPLPPNSISFRRFDMHFSEHLDALDGCLIYSLNDYNMLVLDGWVMKDKSWTKLFSLRLSDSLCDAVVNFKLVAYLKEKQQVVVQYNQGFSWYDLANNNSVLNFSVHGFPRIASSKICPRSLVLLKGRDSAKGFGIKATTRKRKRKTKKIDDKSLRICVRDKDDLCCTSIRFCSEDLCDCNLEKISWESLRICVRDEDDLCCSSVRLCSEDWCDCSLEKSSEDA